MFNDVSSIALRSALDALSARQRVIADNMANVNTPGFLAGRVTFEAELSQALAAGRGDVAPTVARSLEPTRENGNNVNLDHEVLANVDTGLRYQLMIRAVDHEFSLVRTAARTA